MPGKYHRVGPTDLGNSAANIFNPPTVSGGTNTGSPTVRAIIRRVQLVNHDSAAHTTSLFVGATGGSAAGTEFCTSATSIPANSEKTYYPSAALVAADFLTGFADAANKVSINLDVEYLVG